LSDTDIRAWALANGRKVPARGPISRDVRDAYHAENGDDLDLLEPGDDEFDLAEPGPPPPDTATVEKKPRTIAAPKASRFGFGKAKTGAKKPARKRVPVDEFIASAWRGIAGLCKPLPATSRLLKIQAPVAGVILEDTIKNTVVDKWMQPLARAQQSGTAMFALAGPPVLVTALQLQPQSAPFIMPVLRESMLAWCKVAGPKMEQALKREREFEAEFGDSVDAMLAFILADMIPDSPAMTAEQEEAEVQRMQQVVQGSVVAA
jgi:hypothetical protein